MYLINTRVPTQFFLALEHDFRNKSLYIFLRCDILLTFFPEASKTTLITFFYDGWIDSQITEQSDT